METAAVRLYFLLEHNYSLVQERMIKREDYQALLLSYTAYNLDMT